MSVPQPYARPRGAVPPAFPLLRAELEGPVGVSISRDGGVRWPTFRFAGMQHPEDEKATSRIAVALNEVLFGDDAGGESIHDSYDAAVRVLARYVLSHRNVNRMSQRLAMLLLEVAGREPEHERHLAVVPHGSLSVGALVAGETRLERALACLTGRPLRSAGEVVHDFELLDTVAGVQP